MPRSIERSRQLRKRLKSDLFPLLEAHGFFPLKHTSLFYEFGRLRNGQLHVYEIMWDKYHRPRFIVNFGRAQVEVNDSGVEGIRNPYMDQWLPIPDAGAGVLAESNRVYRGRMRRQWFTYGVLRGIFSSGGDQRVVSRCIDMLPLVESWFSNEPQSVEVVDRMNRRSR